jgi:heat shock protein HslJ
MRPALRLLAVVAALLVLAACGDDDEPVASRDGTTPPDGPALAEAYVSTEVREGGELRPLVEGTRIQLGLADGRIHASLGCNSLSGTYRLEGGVLVVEDGLAMTEMGCDPPRHAQDEWFAELLGAGPTVELDGDVLTLTAGDTVVVFQDREVAEPDRDLVGTTWEVDGYADGADPDDAAMSAPADVTASVRFEGNGYVTGRDGCNDFGFGGAEGEVTDGLRYEVDGDQLVLTGAPASTMVACPSLDEHLDRFWSALTGTVTWSVEADRLRLTGEDGRAVTFRAVD